MHEAFYGFSAHPFRLTPDTRFYFGSAAHRRAIAHLVYGLAQKEGFIVITGEVGAGKTTLIEQLWEQLDRDTFVIGRIATTRVSGDDLLRLAVTSLGGRDEGADKATLLRRFEAVLRDQRDIGRRVLLVVDEVQNLSFPALEELRMLSNIMIEGEPNLQTILVGQPQFRGMLASPDLGQLRQRILASFHLGPLTPEETKAYIEHRLRIVGWADRPRIDDAAFAAIHAETDGIPRRVNTLCSRVLLFAALEEAETVTAPMIETVSRELKGDLGRGASVTPTENTVAEPLNYGRERLPERRRNDPWQAEVINRLERLERNGERRDRIFRRLLDLIEEREGATRP